MGERRTELIAWVNDLLQYNYTKVEQLGSGAAYCQIMDSVYADVHMNRVKFNAKMEYEFVNNFKILQACFDKHKIDKSIPVTKLVKCKMQDNLEFLQWIKKYWDSYFPGGGYDAVARRGTAAPPGAPGAGPGRSAVSHGSSAKRTTSANASARVPLGGSGKQSGRVSSASGRASPGDAHSSAMIQDLTRQTAEMRVTVDGLEKERDFYFQKLREIEVLVQQQLEELQPGSPEADAMQLVQQILYSTEEGFDVPQEEQGQYAEQYEDDVF